MKSNSTTNDKDVNIVKKSFFTFQHAIVVFIFLFLATYFNSYFFYKHASRDIDRDIIHRTKDIKTFTSYCMKNNANNSIKCINDLKLFISDTPVYYGALYIIKNDSNKSILKAGHMDRLEGDNSAYTLSYIKNNSHNFRYEKLFKKLKLSQEDIKDLTYIKELNATLEIKKHAVPNALIATYRSLTFSVSDWIPMLYKGEYKKAINFILHAAFPRSWPAILFGFMAYFLYRYIKYEEKKHLLKLKKSDKKLLEALRYEKADVIPDLERYSNIIDKVVPTEQLMNFIKTYPKGVVTECRLIGEMLVKSMDKSCTSEDDQVAKINCLYNRHIIDKKTKNNLHTIRLLGNLAVHEVDTSISKNDALLALNALISVFNSPHNKVG